MDEAANEVNQRLRQYLGANRISVNFLSKTLNVPQPTLHRQLGEEGCLSVDNLQAILTKFPDLSADWLLLGKGSMLRSEIRNVSAQPETVEMLQKLLEEEKERSNKYWDTIQKLINK